MAEATAFGALLRRYRTLAGLTQEGLAARANISTRAVSDLERGINRAPLAETLELLASALDITSEERIALIAAAHPDLKAPPAGVKTPASPSRLPLSTRISLSGSTGRGSSNRVVSQFAAARRNGSMPLAMG